MLKLFSFLLVFIYGLSCFSQDTTLIHKRFFKTQQVAMGSLGAWSVGNLIVSPLLSNNIFKSGSSLTSGDYFHQMNFNWNIVNGAIAGLGYWSVCRRKKKSWNFSSLEKEKKKLKTSLAVNMGLDVVYIVSGILLNRAGHNNPSNAELKIGYGNSLILQGGFLLVFDGLFLFNIVSKK
jgi:hypothetical protein